MNDVLALENSTLDNNVFRRVVSTTKNQQLVLMTLKPGEAIGLEVHLDTDQFLRIEEGTGIAVLADKKFTITAGDSITVRIGTWHNIINTGTTPMKLYTIYSPPHHPEDLIQVEKPRE
jgi:mannose-6-phosphate isomerase-like protein (cupin superfamily)